MPQQKQNIPKLRFPEFSGDWKESQLGEAIATLSAGVSVNSVDRTANNNEMGILKTSCVTNGVFECRENKVVVEPNEISRLRSPVKAGTIIISRMNTPNLVGANAFVHNDFDNLFLPDRLWAASINSNFSARWIAALLASDKLRAILSDRASGTSGSMKNISKPDVLSISIIHPLFSEQEKIAAFLTAVDELIAKLQEKQRLLSQYKTGVMQQIFEQKIRFTDDTGKPYPAWEESLLGMVCTINKGEQLNKSELTTAGDYPALNGGISPSGYTNVYNTNENTITISEGGNSCGYVNYIKQKFWCGGHCYALLNLNKAITTLFLYQILKYKQNEIMALRVGSGLPNIQKKGLNNLKLQIPSPKEQQKIANFLSSIDKKVDVIAEQIKQTQAYKKGLLQQMFV